MYIALDKDGNRVNIANTHEKEEYFCPMCGAPMVLKKGTQRAHHFAHPRNCHCTDRWNYELSNWSHDWQEQFPEETREVVLSNGKEKHRANVYLADKHLVIEFQHASLPSRVFDARNEFFTSLGNQVIWLFDFTDPFAKKALYPSDDDEIRYRWNHPSSALDNFDYKDKRVKVYFQISLSNEQDEDFQECKGQMESHGDEMSPEDEDYYQEHLGNKGKILEISWVAPEGFEHFISDSYTDSAGFVSFLMKGTPLTKKKNKPK
jgi:competence CoiA-like predicted nuclease